MVATVTEIQWLLRGNKMEGVKQVDVLQSFLDDFYDLSEQDGFSTYSRPEQKKTLLLLHILIVGLILEGYQMGPRQCDKLRQGLKAHPSLFSSLYRYPSLESQSRSPLTTGPDT